MIALRSSLGMPSVSSRVGMLKGRLISNKKSPRQKDENGVTKRGFKIENINGNKNQIKRILLPRRIVGATNSTSRCVPECIEL